MALMYNVVLMQVCRRPPHPCGAEHSQPHLQTIRPVGRGARMPSPQQPVVALPARRARPSHPPIAPTHRNHPSSPPIKPTHRTGGPHVLVRRYGRPRQCAHRAPHLHVGAVPRAQAPRVRMHSCCHALLLCCSAALLLCCSAALLLCRSAALLHCRSAALPLCRSAALLPPPLSPARCRGRRLQSVSSTPSAVRCRAIRRTRHACELRGVHCLLFARVAGRVEQLDRHAIHWLLQHLCGRCSVWFASKAVWHASVSRAAQGTPDSHNLSSRGSRVAGVTSRLCSPLLASARLRSPPLASARLHSPPLASARRRSHCVSVARRASLDAVTSMRVHAAERATCSPPCRARRVRVGGAWLCGVVPAFAEPFRGDTRSS